MRLWVGWTGYTGEREREREGVTRLVAARLTLLLDLRRLLIPRLLGLIGDWEKQEHGVHRLRHLRARTRIRSKEEGGVWRMVLY